MLSWQNVRNYYLYKCDSNIDFLNNYNNIPKNNNNDNIYENTIKNKDMIESTNQYNELKKIFINKNLIAFRPGNVESTFLLKYHFDFDLNNQCDFKKYNIDYYIRNNAGLYYKNINRKKEVLDWWCNNTIELLYNSKYCSSYNMLNCDIPLMAKLDLKGKFYNYAFLYKLILENSEGKKILYIGNAVKSIKTGYERNLKKLWNFPVSNFSMYYLMTPQTTIGMDYPHDTMIETCNELIETIKNNYSDFDTAIFGCGCYGSCLMNILRLLYPNKNLIYLGSDCFKMFGITTELFPWQNLTDFTGACELNKDYLFEVIEELPDGCKNHPEKKYWKLKK